MTALYVSSHSISSAPAWRIRICTVLVSLFVMAAVKVAPVRSAEQACSPSSDCFTQARRDLVFIIDRSGSIALRGQTYNVEIQGVARALRDRTVIPRDGSTAVAVVLFSEAAVLSAASDDPAGGGPLRGIDSDEQAEKIAEAVESLRCDTIEDASAAEPCPSSDTRYAAAISFADNYLNKRGRDGAQRVFLISTDGQPSDINEAELAADKARTPLPAVTAPDITIDGIDKCKGNICPLRSL